MFLVYIFFYAIRTIKVDMFGYVLKFIFGDKNRIFWMYEFVLHKRESRGDFCTPFLERVCSRRRLSYSIFGESLLSEETFVLHFWRLSAPVGDFRDFTQAQLIMFLQWAIY